MKYDAVQDACGLGFLLGPRVAGAGQPFAGRQGAVIEEVATLGRRPIGVCIMIVDAQADASSCHALGKLTAQCEYRIASIAYAAGAVQVEHRMSAGAASLEINTHARALLLIELRNSAILCKIRIK